MRTSTTDRHREAGFTLVEVLAAMLVLFVALFGLLSSFESSVRAAHTSERESSAAAIAEQQMEQMLARPYEQLANCTASGTTPAPSGSSSVDPRFLITPGSPPRLMIRRRPRSDTDLSLVAGTPAQGEPFVLDHDGDCLGPSATSDGEGIIAGPLPVTSDHANRLFGTKVFRFVTWADEPGCLLNQAQAVNTILAGTVSLANALLGALQTRLQTGLSALCGQTRDAKRLTVAVVLPRVGNNAGLRKPVYLSTLVPDPDAGTGLSA